MFKIPNFKFTKKSPQLSTKCLNKRNINDIYLTQKGKEYSELFNRILDSADESLRSSEKIEKKYNKQIKIKRNDLNYNSKNLPLFSTEELKLNTIYDMQHIMNNSNKKSNSRKKYTSKIKNINKNKIQVKQNDSIINNKNDKNNKLSIINNNNFKNFKIKNPFKIKSMSKLNLIGKDLSKNIKKILIMDKLKEEDMINQQNKNISRHNSGDKLIQKPSQLKKNYSNLHSKNIICNRNNEKFNFYLKKKITNTNGRKIIQNLPSLKSIDSKNNKNKNKIKKERILCETNNFKDPFNYTINYSKNDYKNMNLFTKYIRTETLKVFPSTKISHNNNNKICINNNKINWALEKSKPILSKNNEKIINLNNSTSENNKNGNIKLSDNISENKDIKTKSFLLIDKRLSFKDKLDLKTKKKNMKKEIVINSEIDNGIPSKEIKEKDKSENIKYNSITNNNYRNKMSIQNKKYRLNSNGSSVRNIDINITEKKLLMIENEFHNSIDNENKKIVTVHSRKLIDRIRTIKKLNNI